MKDGKMKPVFVETKKALEDYRREADRIEADLAELDKELEFIQFELSRVMEGYEISGLSERIYLKSQAKELNSKAEVIEIMKEELAEELGQLKIKTVAVIRETLKEDRKNMAYYDVTGIVRKHRDEMLIEIKERSDALNRQYFEIHPIVSELTDDPAVREVHPRMDYLFSREVYYPSVTWHGDVVNRHDLASAVVGFLPNDVKLEKEAGQR